MKHTVLVVGLGEVGSALYQMILESGRFEVYGYDTDETRTKHRYKEIPRPIDYLHVCYPYTPEFIETTLNYIWDFRPKLTIIHSTVPVGITEMIESSIRDKSYIVHSPVRGKHPKLLAHLHFWTKWIGGNNSRAVQLAVQHLQDIGFEVKCFSSSKTSELAKLVETTYRAWMIVYWQEIHRWTYHDSIDLVEVFEFIREVHEVLKDRPIYYPDVIGGHCLIPNTTLLLSSYPTEVAELILNSNLKREEEIEDENIRRDVERLKEYWRHQCEHWYYT